MYRKEGIRPEGRFIKRNDPILEYVGVSPFNLAEIGKISPSVPDNPYNNIIHQRLHEQEELSHTVKPAPLTTNDLTPEGGRMPVLVPLDFTDEWEAMRKKRSRRNPKFEDDEEEFDLESLTEEAGKAPPIESPPAPEELKEDSIEEEPPKRELSQDEAAEPERSPPLIVKHEQEAMALNDLAQEIKTHEQETPEEVSHDSFAPLVTKPAPEPKGEVLSEAEKEEIYQKALEQIKGDFEAEKERWREQERQNVGELLAQLEGLKKEILINAQDHFKKVCEGLMEGLLKREFELHPDLFAEMIERAVSEAVPDDVFEIKVNSHTKDLIYDYLPEPAKHNLVVDESLENEHFMIDSKNGIVDGNLKEIVHNLLKDAPLDLAHTKGEAG